MQRLEITNFIELMVVRFVHPRIWAKKKKQQILDTCPSKLNKKYTFGAFFPLNRNLFQKSSKRTSPLSAIKHFLVTAVLKYQNLLKQRRENLSSKHLHASRSIRFEGLQFRFSVLLSQPKFSLSPVIPRDIFIPRILSIPNLAPIFLWNPDLQIRQILDPAKPIGHPLIR